MPKKKKPDPKPMYANVCMRDEMRIYTSFGTDLEAMIAQTEFNTGVIAIEEAHAGKPPVWERKEI